MSAVLSVDLGFGSYGIRAPMRLGLLDTEVRQDRDTFMLTKASDREYLVGGASANQYGFDLTPTERHPDAVFVQKLLIVLHNESGRRILLGDVPKIVDNGTVTQRTLAPDETTKVLATEFGLNPTA